VKLCITKVKPCLLDFGTISAMTGEETVAYVLHNVLFLSHDRSPWLAGSVKAKLAPPSLLFEASMVPPEHRRSEIPFSCKPLERWLCFCYLNENDGVFCLSATAWPLPSMRSGREKMSLLRLPNTDLCAAVPGI
jgi:hypothetical protein